VTLKKRAKGSPVLTVQLREADGNEWTRTLAFVAPTFSSAVALTPDHVLVWGATLGNRSDVVLIALDRSTGKQAYTLPFAQPGASVLSLFEWTGKHVLVGFMGGLHAIDPSTGETQWTKGSTGMGGVIVPSQFRDL
jgi:outer membrane protein assembly factor BamB